jgi:hypothetical protein
MQYPKTIKFTPGEWKLIEDRLTVPDAIAEAMTDNDAALPGDKERFHDAAVFMALHGPEVTLEGTYDRGVLEDAVEGSTMPAKLADQIQYGSPAAQREARGLARQIAKVERRLAEIGIHVRFPKY